VKPRALVTGASGFVGRHLATQLESDGWHVIRAIRAEPPGLSPGYLGLGRTPWDAADFVSAIDETRPDVVFHMAGATWAESPAAFYAANVMLAANLLDAVSASQTRPAVVLAGSAAEYGPVTDNQLPVHEEMACNPVTHNGISKYAQTLLGLAHAQAGLRVLVARIFNPVGVGMPAGLALASFAAQIKSGCDVLRVGNLDVTRDFIAVEEAGRLIAALASGGQNYGQVVNICSGHGTALRLLLEGLIDISGRQIRLEVSPARVRLGEMRNFHGDTSRLRASGLTVQNPDFLQILPKLLFS
jgi:nucleoside-diphosphate-sugar epimerase